MNYYITGATHWYYWQKLHAMFYTDDNGTRWPAMIVEMSEYYNKK